MYDAIVVKALGPNAKDDILAHLLSLDNESKRLRFGTLAGNEYITKYVEGIVLSLGKRDQATKCYGAYDAKLKLIGLVHVAVMDKESAEIGISVDSDRRNKKIGKTLWGRGVRWARMIGIKFMYSYCLAENQAMTKLAKSENMVIVTEYGDAKAKLELDMPTPALYIEELMLENMALVDISVKEHMLEICKHMKFIQLFFPFIRICD